VSIAVVNDGADSPALRALYSDIQPAIITSDGTHVVAAHSDYSLVTSQNPARPGDVITLYGDLARLHRRRQREHQPGVTAVCHVQSELIKNGSFESPAIPAWIEYVGQGLGVAATFERTTSTARDGKYSEHVSAATAGLFMESIPVAGSSEV
jgi:hypothetical protein